MRACRAAVSRGDGASPSTCAHQAPGVRGAEGLDDQLRQRAVAAQVVAQAPQRMGAREIVRAVGGDDQERQLVQARRERREQLERGLVGGVDVVEQHDGRALGDHRAQAAADRLEQRRAVLRGPRLAQLGEEQRQVRPQRAAGREPVRRAPQVAPHGGDDRAERRAAAGRDAADQEAVAERLLDEAGLADAGLAGDQQERAAAGPRGGERGPQPRPLAVASDERSHGASVSPAERSPVRPGGRAGPCCRTPP